MKIVDVVGGLGSQMFAYALSVALKEHYGESEVLCDFGAYHRHGRRDHNGAELNRIFSIPEESSTGVLSYVLHSSSITAKLLRRLLHFSIFFKVHDAEYFHYNYDPTVFSEKGWVVYRQCWTSWKYFHGLKKRIKDHFTFPALRDQKNLDIASLIQSRNSVAIHVRRGDYVDNPVLGGLVDLSYYSSALNVINRKVSNPVFFLFSDDVFWCKKNLEQYLFGEYIFIDWNVGANSYIDMQLMAMCKHHIIPNSTFSWWAAYLAESEQQVVVSPMIWANKETGVYLEDMNLPNWWVLDNLALRGKKNG